MASTCSYIFNDEHGIHPAKIQKLSRSFKAYDATWIIIDVGMQKNRSDLNIFFFDKKMMKVGERVQGH